MSKADFWLAVEAFEPISQGKHPEAVRRILVAKLFAKRTAKKPEEYFEKFDLDRADVERLQARLRKSPQNFHKWLARVFPPTLRDDIKSDDQSWKDDPSTNRVNFSDRA